MIIINVLDKWSKQTAWLFGYYYADGYFKKIKDSNSLKYRIYISSIDLDLINTTREYLDIDKSLSYYTQPNNKVRNTLVFYNEEIGNNMKAIGIQEGSSKTLDNNYINVPYEYRTSFWLGFWNGDGGVSLKETSNRIIKSLYFYLTCESMKDELVKWLNSIGVEPKISIKRQKSGFLLYDVRTCKYDEILRIYDEFEKSSTYICSRKLEKLKEIKSLYERRWTPSTI